MALISPLLILLLLGLWEVGRIVEAQQILSNAAREAGRQAAIDSKTGAQVQQDVLTYIQQAGLNNSGVTLTINNLTSGTVNSPETAQNLDHLKITVSMPTSNVRWVLVSHFVTSNTINGTAHWYSLKNLPVSVPLTIPAN
jgi:Flp pilus assembly protein TadG